jgi:hypothetical protein
LTQSWQSVSRTRRPKEFKEDNSTDKVVEATFGRVRLDNRRK